MTYYSYNDTDSTVQSLWFNFKAKMKLAGWTVPSSSDGTTYNASGDQITVNATSGAGAINTSSWFILTHPTLDTYQRHICIQFGAGANQIRVKLSWSGFSAGTPGIARVPSAADEQILIGSGTDASPTYTSVLSSIAGNINAFMMCGDVTEKYHFYFLGTFPGSNLNQFIFTMERLTDTHPLDIDPYIYFLNGSTSNLSGFDTYTSCILTSSGASQPFAWYKKGLAGATFTRYSTGMLGANATSNAPAANLGTNPYDKKASLIPMYFGRGGSWTTQLGWKGTAVNMYFSGLARNTGAVLSKNTTNDYIYFGPFTVFKWDGSNPKI